jgi:uncharacterized membrane protein YcaP (DUF421 family)
MDLAIRAVILYAFVLLLMRVTGRREISSLSASDLVLLIVLGDAIQQGLTQDDYSVTGAVIVVATIAILQLATSYLGFRFKRFRNIVEGVPVLLIDDGKVLDENLRRQRLTRDDLAEEMRLDQIPSFDHVRWAIFETNGKFSFITKDSADV